MKEKETEAKSESAPFIELDVNAVDIDISKTKSVTREKSEKKTHVKEEAKKEETKEERKEKRKEEEEDKMEVDNQDAHDTDEMDDFQLVLEDTIAEIDKQNVKATPPKTEKPPAKLAKTPRRVQLITLSSPKRAKAE